MTPSQGETSGATHQLAQEFLQLQEYAQQLQAHFERMEQELSQDSQQEHQAHALVNHMQNYLKQIQEHVAQMRG